MELNYKLTENEYLDFNKKYIRSSPMVLKIYIYQKLFVAITLAIILYFIYREFTVSFLKLFLFYILALFVWSFLEYLVFKLIISTKLRFNIRKDSSILEEKNLIIKNDGIYDENNPISSRIIWKRIKTVEKVEEFIFIFTTLDYGYIIPRRVFDTEMEEDRFLSLITSKIEK